MSFPAAPTVSSCLTSSSLLSFTSVATKSCFLGTTHFTTSHTCSCCRGTFLSQSRGFQPLGIPPFLSVSFDSLTMFHCSFLISLLCLKSSCCLSWCYPTCSWMLSPFFIFSSESVFGFFHQTIFCTILFHRSLLRRNCRLKGRLYWCPCFNVPLLDNRSLIMASHFLLAHARSSIFFFFYLPVLLFTAPWQEILYHGCLLLLCQSSILFFILFRFSFFTIFPFTAGIFLFALVLIILTLCFPGRIFLHTRMSFLPSSRSSPVLFGSCLCRRGRGGGGGCVFYLHRSLF